MAIISCPECEKEVSDRASSCPNCGINVYWNSAPEHGSKMWQMFASGGIAFFIGIVLFYGGVNKTTAVILTIVCAQLMTFVGFPMINRLLAQTTRTRDLRE